MSGGRILIASVQTGLPRTIGVPGATDMMNRPVATAFLKTPAPGPVRVSEEGLEGDGVADRRHHGGADKAVLAYAAAHYALWRAELAEVRASAGHDPDRPEIAPGAFAENLTIEGQDETSVCIGDVYAIGAAVRMQVSQPRQPCWKIARHWRMKEMTARVKTTGRTGWYLRVLAGGEIAAGMELVRIERPHAEWTVARCNEVMDGKRERTAEADALFAIPELSAAWKEDLFSS